MKTKRTGALVSSLSFVLSVSTLCLAADRPIDDPSLMPPDAKAGQCFARVIIPAEYKEISEKVLKKGESETVKIIPAQFAEVEEKVLVREPTKKLEIVPATFETVEEKVMIKPEAKKLEEVPAEYETITEQVLEKPARTVWKKGTGPVQKVDHATGDIMCLVEEPAVYKTVTREVLKTAPTTRELVIPAEYKTIKKKVVKQPETVREIEVPGEYQTIPVTKIVSPPREERAAIPAEYQEVVRKEKLTEQRIEWRQIMCETNINQEVIKQVQAALGKAGFPVGKQDGVFGASTRDALNLYQKSKGLPVDGYLNLETVKSLGLDIKV